MTTKVVHEVRVRTIDLAKRTAMCSWNGNPARLYRERDIDKLKENEPILVKTWMGERLPTREERAAIIAERKAKEQA